MSATRGPYSQLSPARKKALKAEAKKQRQASILARGGNPGSSFGGPAWVQNLEKGFVSGTLNQTSESQWVQNVIQFQGYGGNNLDPNFQGYGGNNLADQEGTTGDWGMTNSNLTQKQIDRRRKHRREYKIKMGIRGAGGTNLAYRSGSISG